jgi:protein MpaA
MRVIPPFFCKKTQVIFWTFQFCSLTHASLPSDSSQVCRSVKGVAIEHFEKSARPGGMGKKILVFGQVHGDEKESGILTQAWLERIKRIEPSNHWRIIPVMNPDGVELKTRTNANKVDLNRNFPTKDWDELALKFWREKFKSEPRRFPGEKAGSEPETQCALWHLENFKPDVVVSIHTPYGLFDFDGPAHAQIKTQLIPWKRLGTFTGSLGRYMWEERGVPVLTIEIAPHKFGRDKKELISFQDKITDLLIRLGPESKN